METIKYPDGATYIKVDRVKDIRITFKLNSYEALWHLHQFVDAYNNAWNVQPVITIPNLIDAQADDRFGKGQSFGLKLVCDFLNKMNAKFRIFHPHNPQVVKSLIDNVEIIDNSEFIKKVMHSLRFQHLRPNTNRLIKQDTIIMSSDAGGFKPLMSLCNKIKWMGETTSAAKFRNKGADLVQIIDRNDYEGKDILIVDDISIYGGTFKGLSKLLREANCGKLYLAVSHMTVPTLINRAKKDDKPVTDYFDKVFTTNSKYDEYLVPGGLDGIQPNNLEIIKMF